MKTLLVPWMLLLFGVSLNSGHYIRESQHANPSIYEVQDSSSGITFVNPKPEKPTLREILYYHIIERPREEPVVTERSATNSHGYQFLDLQSLLEDSYDEKDQEDNKHDGSYIEHSDDEKHDGSYLEHSDDEQHEETEDQDTENLEEDPELTTTPKPLTDEEVKEAYKSRSYLFDQARQRYAVKRMAVPDSLNRRKRQAEMEAVPEAPTLASNSKEAYMQPNTYGMNLDSDGGYVWNNLNKPPTYYELGPSNGNPDEGSYGSSPSQENTPPSETAYIPPVSEPSDSGSAEDIYVINNGPSTPYETKPEPIAENPEPSIENQEPIIENPEPSNSGANYPVEPILGSDDSNDKSESNEGFANPIGPEVYQNPEQSYPVQPEIPKPIAEQEDSEALPAENPISEGPAAESNENPGYGNGQQPGETKTDNSSGESAEGDRFKEIPVAPTLPPLNFDNLPGYVREAISSTEQPESYEHTENPYENPQSNPEDKQVMEDKMEGVFSTMTPVEDIPKTYGMNLSSEGGHVWNDMVNPPASYDVGSPSEPEEEHKEQLQPATTETENPISEITEPIINPEEPNQETESNGDEPKPVEEPAEPEKEELEEPINNPNEGNSEPPTPESEDNKPTDEPAETVEPENHESVSEPGNEESENHEPIPEPGNGEQENAEIAPEPGNEETQPDDAKPSEEPAEEKPEEEEKPDIMNELLKSEQFWKWLGEWTATYTELLEKHIRKIAIQEICNREKSGEQMCVLEDKSEETGFVIKDGKIIVDGKEIDMTHTDNLDRDLKKGHHNNKDDKKNKNENKVQASTIYGNSVGNEKVTNIFIFTADNADEVIDSLKPANESEIDFIIDDRIKEDNKDEKDKEISVDVDTDTEEPNASGANKEEANESEPNKEAPSSEEANKNESNEGEPNKEEVNNEDVAKEESTETEANTEALSNGGVNKNESSEGEADVGSNKNGSNQEELNKNNENKKGPTSGDIEESEHEEIDESKLEPSGSESK